MAEFENTKPVLLIKKAGGMLLLVIGCALTAAGFGTGSNGLATVGIVLLAIGLLLLILKIVRRNQGSS
jgi:uncharacterized membrane protein YccC